MRKLSTIIAAKDDRIKRVFAQQAYQTAQAAKPVLSIPVRKTPAK